MLSNSSYILVYKYWWFSCSFRHDSICHLTFHGSLLLSYIPWRVTITHETAGLNTYLGDLHLIHYDTVPCSALPVCSLAPSWSVCKLVIFTAIPSSVWYAVIRQHIYLFHYSSKKCNISFQSKWAAQVPPFGAGPSLSCFCCSRSRSSGDGPGPDHRDCKTRYFLQWWLLVKPQSM